MLTGIHFLLTYDCIFECDHCFLYCKPGAGGTFSLEQITKALNESKKIGTIKTVFFEGGEPFLYYPLLLESVRETAHQGFNAGLVTNCYWATTEADAALWLKPMRDAGLNSISVSNDTLHYEDPGSSPPVLAQRAAATLGIEAGEICIESPTAADGSLTGDVMFRGRAADTLVEGLPTIPPERFDQCTSEELIAPKRVHVDALGEVHVCQGISMGNMWKTPLSELVAAYKPDSHPIIAPLVRGGPYELARHYDVEMKDGYVDECHLCFETRRALLDRFPDCLCPRLVYGVD